MDQPVESRLDDGSVVLSTEVAPDLKNLSVGGSVANSMYRYGERVSVMNAQSVSRTSAL